ncbi:MAG TPA: CBS domain-containing protein [Jatrophihabitantaceae bacterium]|jgi:CBS domain-containing protein|nr:CBS domain-containing protein [Jatrophihabitantaceae bacterium]
MRISDVLARKGSLVATVRPTTIINDALDKLAEHNIGALIVRDADGEIVGIISERDIVRALPQRGPEVLSAEVSEIMTSPLVTATPHTDVVDAMRSMTDRRVRHLPVLDEGELVGIVSIGDIVKNRIDELEAATDQLTHYITGSR